MNPEATNLMVTTPTVATNKNLVYRPTSMLSQALWVNGILLLWLVAMAPDPGVSLPSRLLRHD